MKKITLIVALILSNNVFADVYVGGKLGSNALNNACHGSSVCDSEEFLYGFYIGYSFNDLLSLEYSVDYLGDFQASLSDVNKIEGNMNAISLTPKFNAPLNDSFNLFTRFGAGYIIAGEEKDLIPTFSAGAEYSINNDLGFRIEYQRYVNMTTSNINEMDSNVFSLGVNFNLN